MRAKLIDLPEKDSRVDANVVCASRELLHETLNRAGYDDAARRGERHVNTSRGFYLRDAMRGVFTREIFVVRGPGNPSSTRVDLLRRRIDASKPSIAHVTIIPLPPALTSGRLMPLVGIDTVATATLIKLCTPIVSPIPNASSLDSSEI